MQGKILIAKPFLKDPFFGGKVVLIARFDEKVGAEGFILNGEEVGRVGYGGFREGEDVPVNKDEVFAAVENGEMKAAPLYHGGPCRTGGLVMIHGYADYAEDAEDKDEFELSVFEDQPKDEEPNEIIPGVYFGSPATLAQIVGNGRADEGKFRFFTGVAGWSPGQLESEIKAGAWEVQDATPDIVFDLEVTNKLVSQTPEAPETPSVHNPYFATPSDN